MIRHSVGRRTSFTPTPAPTRRALSPRFEPLEHRKMLAPLINEVYFDPPGGTGDVFYEYIELRGEPSTSTDNLYLIILENEGGNASPGDVEMIFDLNGLAFGENGFLTFREKNPAPNQYTVNPKSTNLSNGSTSPKSVGYGSAGPGSTNPTTLPVMDDANDGVTENSGGTFMLIDRGTGAAPDLADDLDMDDDGYLDDPNGKPGWTILDSIGIHSEAGEAAAGILYGMVNFGPEMTTTSLVGPYFGLGYEIEYFGRWGDATGHGEEDWHVANLTDAAPNFMGMGDFRQSGDPHGFGNQTTVDTNKDVPYGTNLTATLGGPNFKNAEIEGRYLFYNQSAWDGNNAAANEADSAAIATDKSAYQAGNGLFPVSAMSSYTKGINGVAIDIRDLLAETLGPDDFEFRMSNTGSGASGPNNSPESWMLAPDPQQIVVLPDTPEPGVARVLITWANQEITNRYLRVLVKGPDAAGGYHFDTGLPSSDVFYFGSKVGDTFTGSVAALWNTGGSDEVEVRGKFGAGAPITSIWDFDRNKINGTAVDQQAARLPNFGFLTRITLDGPLAPLAGPAASDDGSGSAIASALSLLAGNQDAASPISPDLLQRFEAERSGPSALRTDPSPLMEKPQLLARLADAGRAVDAALDDDLFEQKLDSASLLD